MKKLIAFTFSIALLSTVIIQSCPTCVGGWGKDVYQKGTKAVKKATKPVKKIGKETKLKKLTPEDLKKKPAAETRFRGEAELEGVGKEVKEIPKKVKAKGWFFN